MKKKFSFFRWVLEIKLRNLKEDEKTIFLANELIKSVQRGGNSINLETISAGLGCLDVYVHNFGTEFASLDVKCINNDWSVTGKPTFKTLGEK